VSNINIVVGKVLLNKLYNIAVFKHCWHTSKKVSCFCYQPTLSDWLI